MCTQTFARLRVFFLPTVLLQDFFPYRSLLNSLWFAVFFLLHCCVSFASFAMPAKRLFSLPHIHTWICSQNKCQKWKSKSICTEWDFTRARALCRMFDCVAVYMCKMLNENVKCKYPTQSYIIFNCLEQTFKIFEISHSTTSDECQHKRRNAFSHPPFLDCVCVR